METSKRQHVAFLAAIWPAAFGIWLGRYVPVDYSFYALMVGVLTMLCGFLVPDRLFAPFNVTVQLLLKLMPALTALFGVASSIANNRFVVYGKDFDALIMGITMLATFLLIGFISSSLALNDIKLVARR